MTELPLIAACSLDEAGLAAQRERYRLLSAQVEEVVRGERSLRVRFGAGVDESILAQAIAVERDCCPFFRLAWEPQRRLLTIEVAERRWEPALEALAGGFGAAPPASALP